METFTRTPDISFYISGYGLVFILAIIGAREVLRQKTVDPKLLLMICWAVAGISAAYLVNLPFQRKLVMGEDVPLSLLAGVGAMSVARRARPQRQTLVAVLIVLATIPSTLFFLARDLSTLRQARHMAGSTPSPYLSTGETQTLAWLSANTSPSDGILAPMRLSLLIPGFCDRNVWAAHWSETPRCEDKLRQLSAACADDAGYARRIALLRTSRARYFCYPNDPKHLSLTEITPVGVTRRYADLAENTPPYLHPVYRNSEYTVFSVYLP
jgi:hypothetical protein